MNYPFSIGDLRDSSHVLMNYIEQQQGGSKVPWDDLKYIFGEIMYGGHIIDPRDRLMCKTYLDFYMQVMLWQYKGLQFLSFCITEKLTKIYIHFLECMRLPGSPVG